MSIIELFFILIIVGVGLYYAQRLPIAQPMRVLITVVAVVLCLIMVIDFFGLWDLGDNWHHRSHWRR
jgi:hypothetical protein